MSEELDFDPPKGDQDPLKQGISALDEQEESTPKNKREPDELDEIINKLQLMVVGYGFPEPGNLRSKNKKEVKKTIK